MQLFLYIYRIPFNIYLSSFPNQRTIPRKSGFDGLPCETIEEVIARVPNRFQHALKSITSETEEELVALTSDTIRCPGYVREGQLPPLGVDWGYEGIKDHKQPLGYDDNTNSNNNSLY